MAGTIAKDHDKKRVKILSAAAEVFAREGIARASMNEVAKSGGISKANIYHYYNSKDALIFGILDSYLCELRDLICGIDLANLSAKAQLTLVAREFLLAYEGMDHEHKIQTEGLPLLPDDEQEILKSYQRDMVNFVSGVLEKTSPDYFANNKTRLHETTMSVFGMLNWFYMWNPNANREARITYAQTVATITLGGINSFEI